MPFPVDSKFIDRAAIKLGIRLPVSYIAKIQLKNGGEVAIADEDWQLFPIFDESDKNRIKRTCNDIVRETASARGSAGFPATGVTIAANGGGDHLVLLPNDTGDRLAEIVYRWDHETGTCDAVADDFGELFEQD